MELLTERYADRLAGVLSCYDRIIITGTLPRVCYAKGMTSFLYAKGVRIFDYPQFASPLRDRVRNCAQALAAKHSVAIQHINKPNIKARYFCPSCHQKRVLAYGEWIEQNVLAPVPHRQYVFTVPRMLRPIFSRRRRLLGAMCHIVERLLGEAYRGAEPVGRPGLILFVQTFGDLVNINPHIHVLAADGVFRADGVFVKLPAVPTQLLELGLRSQVLDLLVAEGAISETIAALMQTWRHSGFSVHNAVRVRGHDAEGRMKLAQYMLRAPFSLEKMTYDARTGMVIYRSRMHKGHETQFPTDARGAMARTAVPSYTRSLRALGALRGRVLQPGILVRGRLELGSGEQQDTAGLLGCSAELGDAARAFHPDGQPSGGRSDLLRGGGVLQLGGRSSAD